MAEQLDIALNSVQTGFASALADAVQPDLDINAYLIKRPSATFLMRVAGNSMCGAGIDDGDILVVDKSLPCGAGSIIIAVINGEFIVRRYQKINGQINLCAENAAYSAIKIDADSELLLWGVVRGCIKKFVS